MRFNAIVICAAAVAALAIQAVAGEGDDARLAKARAAVKGLGEGLKGQLMAAIRQGGPVSAIAVCKTVAPALAEQSSKEHGVDICRTALRVRNPANAPDAWERKVLEDFVTKLAAGADPATLERTDRVESGGTPSFRYMKAIPMVAEPCLVCHGSTLDPALKVEIEKLYPEDQATGFKAGELRGAFSVRVTGE